MLTKEQILNSDDLKTEVVHVPAWGDDVTVKALPAYDLDRYDQQVASIGKGEMVENIRARLVVKCLVDDKGKRIFEDSDAVHLGKKSAKAIDLLYGVCQRLCGRCDEELEKNSEQTQGDASIFD